MDQFRNLSTRIEVDARRIQVNNATMQTVFRDLSRAR